VNIVVDMNLSPRWIAWFHSQSVAAVHWSTIGRADATDISIMQWAADNNHIVFTHDLDFGALLAATQSAKPSVVQVRADDNSPEAIGPTLLQAMRQCATELATGALVTIEPGRLRIRLLPFHL
jgi:predicted nuclease of predicted toxin-antitoxin system